MKNLIPELSFKDIEAGDVNAVRALNSALHDHGFFSIIDHGLSISVLDNCYDSSKKFFDLDADIKKKYHNPNEVHQRLGICGDVVFYLINH